jgi:membrane-bound lytic murein transglycosylase D
VLTGIDTEARQGQQPTDFEQNSQAEKRYTIAMTTDNRLVKHFLSIYSADGSKDRLETALKRMGKYREMVLRILHEYDLPDELVYLPVIESLYYNDDLSSAGALGIWQIMPERARAMGLKVNYWIDERKDPEKATRGAAQYLKDLYVMFDDWHLALSAYNRGEYGLGRDLKFARATNMEQAGRAVPKETELFVPQFIATTLICDNPKKYGLKYEFDKVEKCDEVVINEVVDLKIAADCAGTSLAKIHELNPAILAWCTPNNYPNFVLKIPAGTRDRFIEKIAMVKDLNPTSGFVKYRVEKGDCLDKIAKKYFTTVAELKQQNNITGGRLIKLNQQLVIRPGRAYFVKVN